MQVVPRARPAADLRLPSTGSRSTDPCQCEEISNSELSYWNSDIDLDGDSSNCRTQRLALPVIARPRRRLNHGRFWGTLLDPGVGRVRHLRPVRHFCAIEFSRCRHSIHLCAEMGPGIERHYWKTLILVPRCLPPLLHLASSVRLLRCYTRNANA